MAPFDSHCKVPEDTHYQAESLRGWTVVYHVTHSELAYEYPVLYLYRFLSSLCESQGRDRPPDGI